MRRVLQRGKKGDAPVQAREERAVERRDSDDAVEAAAGRSPRGGASPLDAAYQSSLPRDWAERRPGSRRSLSRRSQAGSSKHDSNSDSVSPSRSVASKASHADFADVYDRDTERHQSELNPDVEHQLDARDEDYEDYALPRPGDKEPLRRQQAASSASGRPSRRLSAGFRRLMGKGGASAAATKSGGRPAAASDAKKPGSTLQERLRRTSKRISFRRQSSGDPERDAARESARAARAEAKREAKDQARREKEAEKRRQREMKSNPWYPAGVDFRYLSPKSKWLPFLGRKARAEDLDFGDEARLVGVAQ